MMEHLVIVLTITKGYFRVLYAASSPVGCFVETLVRYRTPPNVEHLISAFNAVENTANEQISFGTVPASWLFTRSLGEAQTKRTRFADVYRSEWLSYLRRCLGRVTRLATGILLLRILIWRGSCHKTASLHNKLRPSLINSDMTVFYQSRHGSDLFNWHYSNLSSFNSQMLAS
jgi:hypothetical protein